MRAKRAAQDLQPPKINKTPLALSLTNVCLDIEGSDQACEESLRFTPDFQARITNALATNDRLEMSAYDIGTVLGEQQDLITEFDALYRATSTLVIRLVNLRIEDQAEINQLRSLRAQLTQDLNLSIQAVALADQELALLQDRLNHTQALIAVRDGEMTALQARIHALEIEQQDARTQAALDLESAEGQAQILRDQLTEANVRLAQLGEQLKIETNAHSDLSSALTREQAVRITAEQQLAENQERTRNLEAEITAIKEERDGLIQTITHQTSIIEELKANQQSADQSYEDLNNQLDALAQEREALIQERDAAQNAQIDVEQKWQTAIEQRDTAQNALNEAQEALAPLETAFATAESTIEELNKQLSQITAQRDDLMEQWDMAEAALNDQRQVTADQQATLAQITQALQAAEAQNAALTARLKKITSPPAIRKPFRPKD